MSVLCGAPIVRFGHVIAEGVIRGAIREFQLSPQDLFIGLNNACAHGDIFGEIDWGKDEEHLGGIFDGIEKSLEHAKLIEKGE